MQRTNIMTLFDITSQIFLPIIITKHSTNILLYDMYPQSQIFVLMVASISTLSSLAGWWVLQGLHQQWRQNNIKKNKIIMKILYAKKYQRNKHIKCLVFPSQNQDS